MHLIDCCVYQVAESSLPAAWRERHVGLFFLPRPGHKRRANQLHARGGVEHGGFTMCTSSIFREAAQQILSQAALASMAAEGGAYGIFWPMIWDQNLLPTLAVPPGSAPQPATGFGWFGGWRPAYGL